MHVSAKPHVALIAAAALGLAATPAAADFYSGKQINFIVGYSPGGGYDTYTRMLAGYIGKYIPGNPGVIVCPIIGVKRTSPGTTSHGWF